MFEAEFESNPEVAQALQEGIANSLDGVEADDVVILGVSVSRRLAAQIAAVVSEEGSPAALPVSWVQAGDGEEVEEIEEGGESGRWAVGRELQDTSSSGDITVEYEIRVAEETAAANGIDADAVEQKAETFIVEIDKAIRKVPELNQANVTILAIVVSVPDMVIEWSASTSTLTATVSSTSKTQTVTSTSTITTTVLTYTVVRMVGSVTFTAPVTAEMAETATAASLNAVLDLNAGTIAVTVVESRRLRRLAGSWTATYVAIVTPEGAVALASAVAALSTGGYAEFKEFLLDELVQAGGDRATLTAELDVRSISAPAMSSMAGPAVEACGTLTCPIGFEVKEYVPLQVCTEALTCDQALALCCIEEDSTTPAPGATSVSEDPVMASSTILAVAAIVIAVVACVAACAAVTWRRRSSGKQALAMQRHRSGSGADFLDSVSPKEQLAVRSAAPGGSGPTQNSDLNVVQLLLNDLQGEWRLYDGDTLMPGLVKIGEAGYTLYDDTHWHNQDLIAEANGIVRADGWYVDMQRSDTDLLEWCKGGEAGISWKRCKGISGFSIGDCVEWTQPEEGVTPGARGTVIGFTDTRVKVQFQEQILDAKPIQIDIVQKANGLGDDPAVGTHARGLPSLALCMEFKRLSLYVEEMSRENTELSQENDGLRRELTNKTSKLDRENTRLRSQLDHAEELRREMTNTMNFVQENANLTSQNERMKAQLAQADLLGKELTEMSLQNERLANQLKQVGASPTSQAGGYGTGGSSSSGFGPSGFGPVGTSSAQLTSPMASPTAGGGGAGFGFHHQEPERQVVPLSDFKVDDDSDDTDDEFIAI